MIIGSQPDAGTAVNESRKKDTPRVLILESFCKVSGPKEPFFLFEDIFKKFLVFVLFTEENTFTSFWNKTMYFICFSGKINWALKQNEWKVGWKGVVDLQWFWSPREAQQCHYERDKVQQRRSKSVVCSASRWRETSQEGIQPPGDSRDDDSRMMEPGRWTSCRDHPNPDCRASVNFSLPIQILLRRAASAPGLPKKASSIWAAVAASFLRHSQLMVLQHNLLFFNSDQKSEPVLSI